MFARVLALIALPRIAHAHAIDARYELPVPLIHFIMGAVTAVALTFVIAAIWLRRPPAASPSEGTQIHLGALLPVLRPIATWLSVPLFGLTLAAALFGTRDPMMNLAPTMLWVVWWVASHSAVTPGSVMPMSSRSISPRSDGSHRSRPATTRARSSCVRSAVASSKAPDRWRSSRSSWPCWRSCSSTDC